MKPSSKDRAQGKYHEVKGKVKEKMGRAADDPVAENQGADEKTGGKIQRKIGEIEKVFGS